MFRVSNQESPLRERSHLSSTAQSSPLSQQSLTSAAGGNRSFLRSAVTHPTVSAIKTSGSAKLTTSMTEAQVVAAGATKLVVGRTNVYIGYQQKSADNQDPIVIAFSGGKRKWARTDYEVTGADSKGYGLFYAADRGLYALFSTDGTQGTASQDFRRAAATNTQGYTRTYGSGGGAKVSVVAKIDPATGQMQFASYLSSVLSSGKSNSLLVSKAMFDAVGDLSLTVSSYFGPRRVDGRPMVQTDTKLVSPFTQTLKLTNTLKTVKSSTAIGWR